MQRDMDLIRNLLLHFEAYDSFAMERDTEIEGYSYEEVGYHLILLAQANLIVFEAERSSTTPERLIRVYPFGLSWAGHEFLDAAKNDTLWNKTKEKVRGATGGLSLGLLQALLLHYAKQELGLIK